MMPTGKQIEEFTGRHTSVTIDFGGDIGLKGQDPRLRGRKFMRLSRAVAKESLLFLALVALIGLVATPCASGQTIGKPPSQAAKQALPRGKKTILGLYVTAKEAYEWWKAAPEKVKILDVRTPEEYIMPIRLTQVETLGYDPAHVRLPSDSFGVSASLP